MSDKQMPDPFSSPKDLLNWALADMQEMHSTFISWVSNTKFNVRFEPAEGSTNWELIFHAPNELPSNMPKLCHNAANAVRHAYDQATYALVRHLNPARDGDAYFPWSSTPNDMIGKLRRIGIPDDLHPVFAAYAPYNTGIGYEGGDDLLRDFSKAVNPNKHRVALAFRPACNVSALNIDFEPGKPVDGTIMFRTGSVPIGSSEAIAIFENDWGSKAQFVLELDVSFQGSSVLEERSVFDFLQYARSKALAFIDDLEPLTIATQSSA